MIHDIIPTGVLISESGDHGSQVLVDAVLVQENNKDSGDISVTNSTINNEETDFISINNELKEEERKLRQKKEKQKLEREKQKKQEQLQKERQKEKQRKRTKNFINFHYNQFKNKLYANWRFNRVVNYHHHHFDKFSGISYIELYKLVNYDLWENRHFQKAYVRFLIERFSEIGFRATDITRWASRLCNYGDMIKLEWNEEICGDKYPKVKAFVQKFIDKQSKIEKQRELYYAKKKEREKKIGLKNRTKQIANLFKKIQNNKTTQTLYRGIKLKIIKKNANGKKEMMVDISENIKRLSKLFETDITNIYDYNVNKFKNDCVKINGDLFRNVKTLLLKKKFKILDENETTFHIYWDNMEYEKGLMKYSNNH